MVRIREEIGKMIKAIAGKDVGNIMVSERADFGNYSTNAPFLLAKEMGKSPVGVAQELAEKIIAADKGRLFAKVEAAGGYVNFFITPSVLAEKVTRIATRKYPFDVKKKKINIEFVSANPTGPLTMANGRGGFLGDALVNVLKAVGHKVTREYYVNDAGNQIKVLGESILAALGKAEPKEEHYKGEYIKERAAKIADRIQGETDTLEIGFQASLGFLKDIKESLLNAGIEFDEWYSEFDNIRGKGKLVEKTLAFLKKKGVVFEKDGAQWLKIGDAERVLVKSDGEATYLLADIAYHYGKLVKRGFDDAITIWGADHHGNIQPLKSGVEMLGIDPRRLHIILTQLVRLVEGGKEVRMSKRKGDFITFDELIGEVGKDAARFFFLMNTPESHMDFDLALAKERSVKNPVYYAQYAYVRCRSIIEKGGSVKVRAKSLASLSSESSLALMRELIKFSDVVRQTAEDYQVNRLTRYVSEVARALHHFYEKERVLPARNASPASNAGSSAGWHSDAGGDAEGEQRAALLGLVAAAKAILKKLFDLIGIEAPEKM